MERHLNLIKNETGIKEKRVLPRFPFCYLLFKCEDQTTHYLEQQVFEINDISFQGMQMRLRYGKHHYKVGQKIKGQIHWLGKNLDIEGEVKWSNQDNIGIEFSEKVSRQGKMKEFLSVKNIVRGLRPLHHPGLGLELPSNLKYWLKADGPIELFIWTHADGEFSKFQVIMFHHFVEWEDGAGLKTGRSLSNKNVEVSLSEEDEFIVEMDLEADKIKIDFAMEIVTYCPAELIPQSAIDFLKIKLTF